MRLKLGLLVVFLASSFVMSAQVNYIPYQSRNRYIALKVDSTFHIPSGTTPSLRTGGYDYRGALFYRTSDSSVYVYTGTQWIQMTGAGSDTDSTIFATLYRVDTAKTNLRASIALKLNISDTASKTWDWGDITGKPSLIVASDTSNKWITSVYRKTATDSVFYVIGGTHTFAYKDSTGAGGGGATWGSITGTLSSQTDLNTALNNRVLYTDTAGMLTNYPTFSSFTAGRLALVNGSKTLYSSSKFNFSDATYPSMSIIGSDPLLYIGPSTTLLNNAIFGHGAGASIYGGATYKSVNLYDQVSGGIQMARFYNSGGTIYNNLNGLVISNTTSSPSNYQGSYTIQRTIPYAVTGLNYHGFTDQTDFRVGTNSFNSFGSFVTIGNNRTSQGHFAAFQSVWYKDSTNRLQAIYDFVSAVSEARAGTIDSLYRFKVFEATNTGATIVRQYGIQIDNLTSATTNVGAWIYNNVGIGPTAHTPSEKLVVDGNYLGTGNIKTGDPGSGAGAWKLGVAVTTSGLTLNTTQYVEISIGGTVYRLAIVDPPQP